MYSRLPPNTDFESWTSALKDVCGRFDSKPNPHTPLFIGEVYGEDLGGLELAEVRTNAAAITRLSRGCDFVDDRFCFLIVQRRGECDVSQGTSGFGMRPGDIALVDSSFDCTINPKGLIEHTVFHLPRERLQTFNIKKKFGKVLSDSPSGRLLKLMVEQVCFRDRDDIKIKAEGLAVQDAIISLLEPSFNFSAVRSVVNYSAYGESLRGKVERLILSRLREPALCPEKLAEELGVSVRQLHRVFEQGDETICRFILRARIDKSCEDLSNPLLICKTVTEIAYKWGFLDSAHFSRVFKRYVGCAPRDYRRGNR